MKTISKILVSLGVLMGSMGFIASAQAPTPHPGQHGGKVHNMGPTPKQSTIPGRPQTVLKKTPVINSGRRAIVHKAQKKDKLCQECLLHRVLFGPLALCSHHLVYHR